MMKINSRAFMNMTKGHYYKILQHGLIEREKPVKYPNYMLFPLLAFFDFYIYFVTNRKQWYDIALLHGQKAWSFMTKPTWVKGKENLLYALLQVEYLKPIDNRVTEKVSSIHWHHTDLPSVNIMFFASPYPSTDSRHSLNQANQHPQSWVLLFQILFQMASIKPSNIFNPKYYFR